MKIKGLLIYVGLLAIFAAAFWKLEDELRLKDGEISRLKNDFSQVLQADSLQVVNLTIKNEEVVGSIKRERDSLARLYDAKPKNIEKIVIIDNSVHDTVPVPVPVEIQGRDSWRIQDSGKCFSWEAVATKVGDSLVISRTDYQDLNRLTQTFYKKRSRRFLGIGLGKWVYTQRIAAKCGDPVVRTINFIK